MKKIISMIMVMVLIVSLSACFGGAKKDNNATEENKKTMETGGNPEEKKEEKSEDIVVSELGYTMIPDEKKPTITDIPYAVKITNNNKEYAYRYFVFYINILNDKGEVMKSVRDSGMEGIGAGETLTYAGTVSSLDGKPSGLEVTIERKDEDMEPKDTSEARKTTDFVITDIVEEIDGEDKIYSGNITNKTEKDSTAEILVLTYKKDGKIVGGGNKVLDPISKDETFSFRYRNSLKLDYNEYEITAR